MAAQEENEVHVPPRSLTQTTVDSMPALVPRSGLDRPLCDIQTGTSGV